MGFKLERDQREFRGRDGRYEIAEALLEGLSR